MAHRDPESARAGGAEQTILEVGSRLANRAHSVTLVAPWMGRGPAITSIKGIRVIRVPTHLLLYATLPLLRERIAPDVQVADLAHLFPWHLIPPGRRAGLAFFHHLHARTLPGQVSRVASRLFADVEYTYPVIYRNWNFVTESDQSVTDLIRLGIDSGRIVRIPPGVDSSLFRPGLREDEPRLVYFAGFRRYKRAHFALEVLRELRRAGIDCLLVMVGDGPTLSDLRSDAAESGLGRRVEFTGRVDRATLAQIVGRAWVNLHFSVAEGWGFSIMEASAAGVPTVAFDVPGVRETVLPGVNGTLVGDGDTITFASEVERILNQGVAYQASCRRWAMTHSWEKCALAWEQTLQRQVQSVSA
jgi:glycosyltransferase involved in cell wall biosynthesis